MAHVTKNWLEQGVSTEPLQYTDEFGRVVPFEKYETTMSVKDFDHGKVFRDACKDCGTYDLNLSCPPASPTFEQYVEGADTARVICFKLSLEYFDHLDSEQRYWAGFLTARKLLVAELLEYRDDGYTVAGCGACRACEPCAALTDDQECINPEERIYSLESLGVNVVGLIENRLGIDLEWSEDDSSAGSVCGVGAVFFENPSTTKEKAARHDR